MCEIRFDNFAAKKILFTANPEAYSVCMPYAYKIINVHEYTLLFALISNEHGGLREKKNENLRIFFFEKYSSPHGLLITHQA